MTETLEQEKQQTKKKDQISSDLILLVHDAQGENGGAQIRVVKWIINGKPTQPFLEKRQYRIQNGEKMFLKAKGFIRGDLNILVDHWDEIAKAMEAS